MEFGEALHSLRKFLLGIEVIDLDGHLFDIQLTQRFADSQQSKAVDLVETRKVLFFLGVFVLVGHIAIAIRDPDLRPDFTSVHIQQQVDSLRFRRGRLADESSLDLRKVDVGVKNTTTAKEVFLNTGVILGGFLVGKNVGHGSSF